jgi:hypothetical protein
MLKTKFTLYVLLGLFCFALSCKNKPVRPSENCSNVPATPTYTGQIQALLTANCTSCHNSVSLSGNLNMEDYASAKAVAEIDSGLFLMNALNHTSVSQSDWMPQGAAKLPKCDIETFQRWVNANEPE